MTMFILPLQNFSSNFSSEVLKSCIDSAVFVALSEVYSRTFLFTKVPKDVTVFVPLIGTTRLEAFVLVTLEE